MKANANIKILPLFDDWPPEVKLVEGDGREGEAPALAATFLVETTQYGYTMLPDVSKFGPMYFCKMLVAGS